MITGVTGITRSGTSLMMAMLNAGGMELYHDPDATISWETQRIFDLPEQAEWLDDVSGKAVKLLDAHRYLPLPSDRTWRFVLMVRDARQQALSFQKFMTEVAGLDVPDEMLDDLERSIRSDRKVIEEHIATRGPILKVHFERLLEDPVRQAERIADFCDLAFPDLMADVVLPRSSDCYDGLLEMQLELVYKLARQYGIPPRLAWDRLRNVLEEIAGEVAS